MGDLMSTIKANNLTNTTGGIPTVKSQQLIPTAWVNFNGTGTVAIRDAENVSSITDNGTGRYFVNFATNMANTNYATLLTNNDQYFGGVAYLNSTTGDATTSGIYIRSKGNGDSTEAIDYDAATYNVLIMGGQA
tara:strand:+ start:88 stop:489 length:402 start_codon:yes stop_codon:yes gene_type:complete